MFETQLIASVLAEFSVSSCWMSYLATMTSYSTVSNSWPMINPLKVLLLSLCLCVSVHLSVLSSYSWL